MKSSDNAYLDTVKRMEPNIAMIDAGAGWASIAISLKRIADALETLAADFDTETDEIPRATADHGGDTERKTDG